MSAVKRVKLRTRSRVSNGSALFLKKDVDGRSQYARRLRDLIALFASDLGGAEHLTQAELALIRRASVLSIALEHLEMQFAILPETGADQLDLYQRLSNSQRRILATVGLKRRARDISAPSDLSTYISRRKANRATSRTINGTSKRIRTEALDG